MKSFTKTYVINAPVRSVWQALVVPKIIDEWGGGLSPTVAAAIDRAIAIGLGELESWKEATHA